jgi:hypothetical protein
MALSITPVPTNLGPGPAGVAQLQALFERVLELLVPIAFIVLFIMLFYAGIRFIISGGESKNLGEASKIITWALLGMLFLVLAWLVLRLIEGFTGIPVTKFCIGFKPLC